MKYKVLKSCIYRSVDGSTGSIYKTYESDPELLEEELNTVGKEGWRLVFVLPDTDTERLFIFEKVEPPVI